MGKRLVAVDIFSGSGGLTLGLRQAGFRVAAAVELDPVAAETYRKNHPSVDLVEGDVREVSGASLLKSTAVSRVDLLAGCAPCQGFCSLTRKNEKRDPRNRLVLEMSRLVSELQPTVVFMENVPGLADRGHRLFAKFVQQLKSADYNVTSQMVQMADYGVPQFRRRLVVLAARGFVLTLPPPTHGRVPTKESGIEKWKSICDVIKGLTKPATMREALDGDGPLSFNWHVVRALQPQTLARLSAAIPGKGWANVAEKLRPICHQGTYRGFTNTYGRMTWDQPSVTITSGCTTPCKGRFGHPSKRRTTISVREAAMLQTFPKDYVFASPHIDHVCEMIGNAVPPLFARVIGEHLRKQIRHHYGSLASAEP